MAKIEGVRIKNFKALRDISLGRLGNVQESEPLTALTAVIGKNGVGKSTLFDSFGFLTDCLKLGVEEACDARGRGGFGRIRTQGQTGPIEFELRYKEDGNARPITYELAIDIDTLERPFVFRERLKQRRKGQKRGSPLTFLLLDEGKGFAWKGDEGGQATDYTQAMESKEREDVELDDTRKLGIATLGSFKQHPRISACRKFIEGWYLSYFTPDAARSLPLAGPQKHLNSHGDNLGNVVQFMERQHPKLFKTILRKIAEKIPGIDTINTEKTSDDRLLLRFYDKDFNDPFYSQQISDGTLKVLAYLLLLEDPNPPSFLCIEEPETGLYPKLLESLAEEFRAYTTGRKGGAQVFVTTNSPDFLNAATVDEVFLLEKDKGCAKIKRANDNAQIRTYMDNGDKMGYLWKQGFFESMNS